ncbi:MAG: tyrosine-type recombinase/integrase [Hydrococcus sp. SU_1_0]|nr:tyrosine-type recombinase/integrase [Hydrococcus sp. SU_1_0]
MERVNSQIPSNLENSFNAKIERHFTQPEPNVLTQFLLDKRNPGTRAAYSKDLNDFFRVTTGNIATKDAVLEFLHLERSAAVGVVLNYKAKLFEKGLAESTVNRRLAAIKTLCSMGRKLGICGFTLEDVKGERVQQYRDTSGITPEEYRKVLDICDRSKIYGIRDYALLKLLWDNALRRNEVSLLNYGDFEPSAKELTILGKGKGTQTEIIGLSTSTTNALLDWTKAYKHKKQKAPLFVALDFQHKGHRITGDGIYKMVRRYCKQAGITKRMSPHRVRHSSITAALDATDGNVRKVQKLSRHRQIDTLMIYDDNRAKDQVELSEMLSGLTD